jgi:hypothetical protein
MDLFLRNIDPIAIKKMDKIEKEKKISLKISLERREEMREIKNYNKGRKEKSSNGFANFFARNNGAHYTKKEIQHKKWNVKKSRRIFKCQTMLLYLLSQP